MHDDHTPPRHTARPETDREFETPQSVRELPPDSQQAPLETRSTGPAPAPAPERAAGDDAEIDPTEAGASSELHTTFQRRWEQVQTVFVVGGNRGRPPRFGTR